jgi:hypothetical protein
MIKRVKCIDNRPRFPSSFTSLTIDKEYDVVSIVSPNTYYLVDDSGQKRGYTSFRFVDVVPITITATIACPPTQPCPSTQPGNYHLYMTVIKKVRCIKPDTAGKLKKGLIYEVVGTNVHPDSGKNLYMLVGLKEHFFTDRFEDVNNNGAITVRSMPAVKTISHSTEEQEKAEMMAFFKGTPVKGNCVCGCPKELCRFHKE